MSYQQTRRGNGSETGSSRPRRRETTPEDALAPRRPGVRDSGGDGPSTVVGTVEKTGRPAVAAGGLKEQTPTAVSGARVCTSFKWWS